MRSVLADLERRGLIQSMVIANDSPNAGLGKPTVFYALAETSCPIKLRRGI
jgi:hypothetical protein